MLSNSSNDEIKRCFIIEDREQTTKLKYSLIQNPFIVAGKGHEISEKNE